MLTWRGALLRGERKAESNCHSIFGPSGTCLQEQHFRLERVLRTGVDGGATGEFRRVGGPMDRAFILIGWEWADFAATHGQRRTKASKVQEMKTTLKKVTLISRKRRDIFTFSFVRSRPLQH